MFAATRCTLVRTFTGFNVFAKQAWKLPKVASAKTFQAKSKIVQAAWNKLSTAQKAKYAAVGKRTKIAPRKAAPLNKWQKFVKANYKSVKKLPFEKRVATIAAKWNKQ